MCRQVARVWGCSHKVRIPKHTYERTPGPFIRRPGVLPLLSQATAARPRSKWKPNTPILSPSQPYLVLWDTMCSSKAYGMRPTHKRRQEQGRRFFTIQCQQAHRSATNHALTPPAASELRSQGRRLEHDEVPGHGAVGAVEHVPREHEVPVKVKKWAASS